MRRYQKILYNCLVWNWELIVWGESPIVLQCFCTHKVVVFWESGRVFRHLEPFWVHLDSGSICKCPNHQIQASSSPTFHRRHPFLGHRKLISLMKQTWIHKWRSNTKWLRFVATALVEQLDRALCTTYKPHIGSGDRGPKPLDDPDSLFLGISRWSQSQPAACKSHEIYILELSWTSQSSFLCKAKCSTAYALANHA